MGRPRRRRGQVKAAIARSMLQAVASMVRSRKRFNSSWTSLMTIVLFTAAIPIERIEKRKCISMAPELELQFELHSIFGGSGDVDMENQGSIGACSTIFRHKWCTTEFAVQNVDGDSLKLPQTLNPKSWMRALDAFHCLQSCGLCSRWIRNRGTPSALRRVWLVKLSSTDEALEFISFFWPHYQYSCACTVTRHLAMWKGLQRASTLVRWTWIEFFLLHDPHRSIHQCIPPCLSHNVNNIASQVMGSHW